MPVMGSSFLCVCAQSLLSPTQSTNKTSVLTEVIKSDGVSDLPDCQKVQYSL